MPLTAPAGGTVDLIANVLLTVPAAASFVNFSPVNINADLAYTLEFEIIIDGTDAGNYPTQCYPVTNSDITESIRVDQDFRGEIRCAGFSSDCNPPNTQAIASSSTTYMGTFTWRRVPILNRAVGFLRASQWAGTSFISQGFGGWIFPQTVTNITEVGIVFTTQPTNGFAVGSVFRLYKGSG